MEVLSFKRFKSLELNPFDSGSRLGEMEAFKVEGTLNDVMICGEVGDEFGKKRCEEGFGVELKML